MATPGYPTDPNKIRLIRLYNRAIKCGADENYIDAVRDLQHWPDLRKQIMDDLERAIEAHETGIIQHSEE